VYSTKFPYLYFWISSLFVTIIRPFTSLFQTTLSSSNTSFSNLHNRIISSISCALVRLLLTASSKYSHKVGHLEKFENLGPFELKKEVIQLSFFSIFIQRVSGRAVPLSRAVRIRNVLSLSQFSRIYLELICTGSPTEVYNINAHCL